MPMASHAARAGKALGEEDRLHFLFEEAVIEAVG